MSIYYQKLCWLLFIAVFGGELVIFFLKRLLINPKTAFSLEWSGMMERAALLLLILYGGPGMFFAPLVIIARWVFINTNSSFKKMMDIINREEPALEFQKIRAKSEIAAALLLSPILGIISGVLAKIL